MLRLKAIKVHSGPRIVHFEKHNLSLGALRLRWARRRASAEQVALNVNEGLPDVGDRSECCLRVVRAAIPDAQEVPDLPKRQLLDPMLLIFTQK